MNYNKPKVYALTPSRKRLGKSVARGSRYSLAVHAWKDPKIQPYLLKLIGITLRKEISIFCSEKTRHLNVLLILHGISSSSRWVHMLLHSFPFFVPVLQPGFPGRTGHTCYACVRL